MEVLAVGFFWILFVIFSGAIAASKNRSVLGWVLIAIFLSPIFGLMVAFFPKLEKASPAPVVGGCPNCGKPVKQGAKVCSYCLRELPAPPPDEKICPKCAETVKAAAVVCRFCGADLNVSTRGEAGEVAGKE